LAVNSSRSESVSSSASEREAKQKRKKMSLQRNGSLLNIAWRRNVLIDNFFFFFCGSRVGGFSFALGAEREGERMQESVVK
jgi:hypothetical protein